MCGTPLFRFAIAGDLGIEDGEGILKAGDLGRDGGAVRLQQETMLAIGRVARTTQLRVAQHVAYRQPRRFQAMDYVGCAELRCESAALFRAT